MKTIRRRIYISAFLLLLLLGFTTYGYFQINSLTVQNRRTDKAQAVLKSQETLSADMVQTVIVLSIHQSFTKEKYSRQVADLNNLISDLSIAQKALQNFVSTAPRSQISDALEQSFHASAHYQQILNSEAQSVSNAGGQNISNYELLAQIRANETALKKTYLTLNNLFISIEADLESAIAGWNKAILFSLLITLVSLCLFLTAPSISISVKNQKQLQASLKEAKKSEAMLRTIIDASPDMIFIIDKQQRFQLVNKVMAKRKGHRPEEFIGKTELEMGMDPTVVLGVPEKNIKGLWQHNNEVMESGEPKYFGEEEIRVQGKTKFVSTTKAPLKDDNGVVWGLMGFVHDFTDRVEAEQKLKNSELKYRSLFDFNPLPMWIFDLVTNKFLEVNERAVEHYGYSKKEFAAMSIFDIRTEDDQSELQSVLQSQSATAFNFRGTWAHQKKTGEKIFVEIISHKIEYHGAEAMLVLANDVSKQMELQAQLCIEKIHHHKEIAKATIDVQEKQRDEIGKELHDNVNQILTSAKLYLDCITTNGGDDESYRKTGTRLINSAITEIRRLSKTLVPPSLKDIGLVSSIQDILENIHSTKPIACTFTHNDFDETLFDDGLKLTIYRIIQEQTTNILKYAEASSLTIKICHTERYLHVFIDDNGKGFDTRLHRKGVGITNIFNRANIYHGDVVIDSSPGNGCSLQLSFERQHDSSNKEAAAAYA